MLDATLPLDTLAALTGRSASEVRTYLQVKSFDEAHATDAIVAPVEIPVALEVVVASTLARMCPSRGEMVRLTKKAMREIKRDPRPELFAFDPLTDRATVAFDAEIDVAALAHKLSADATFFPHSGFVRDDDGGLPPMGWVTLNLKQICDRVFYAVAVGAVQRLPKPKVSH